MQQQARVPLWFLAAVFLFVFGAFLLGVWSGKRVRGDVQEPQATELARVLREVLRSHVDEHKPGELVEQAIAGMVRGLDDYSRYFPPAAGKAFDERITGVYEGIGMLMQQHGEDLVVHYPFPGSPAQKAGIRTGDRIVAVDDTPVASFPTAQRSALANERVRGPARATVRLTLARDDQEPFTVTVERAPVVKSSVKWARLLDEEHGLGYVLVADFHNETASQLERAVRDLQTVPGGLRGLVLDLRFNTGGIVEQCVAIARLFLARGNIVTARRRGGETVPDLGFDADPAQCRFPDLPLVLLVNEHTASASEILAGALQDHGRAVVVGTRTYGKGVVNTVFAWRDLACRLALTTAHYYTPKGRSIEKRHRRAEDGDGDGEGGIAPDIAVEADEALQRSILAEDHDQNDVPAEYRHDVELLAQRLGFAVPAPLGPDRDPQLRAALAACARGTAPAAAGQGR